VNTIVVNVAGPAPSLLLVRGSYTPPKPVAEGSTEEEHSAAPLPAGLMMFGGGSYTNFRDAGILFCGNVSCDPRTAGFTYTFGVDVWLTRFLGFEGAYLRPREVKASGGDGTFTFDTKMDTDVWTLAGKVGAQAGVVRLYGKAGMNYHQATTTTLQTMEGLRQTFEYKTTGWNWLYGGGMEAWMGQRQRLAIFADGGIMRIKGDAEGGGEAQINDIMKYITVGVKVRLSR
jgi:hypothetical protein